MTRHLARILLTMILLGSAASATRAADPPSADRPNIVIIYADDLGYGDLGCYGHPTIRTPNLDRMAAEGMRFTSFYSAAEVCTPSRAALMTGRLPLRNGMYNDTRRVLFSNSAGGLPAGEITIAAALKGRGYATACVGKWHLGHLPQYLPTRHGFDSYFGIPYSNDMSRVGGAELGRSAFYKPKVEYWNPPLMQGDKIVERPAEQHLLTKRYTEEAVQFIKTNKSKPFFLYLAHNMPHVPLFASKDFAGKSARGLYGDVVEELDASVGTVLKTLRSEGLDRKTLVVFSSDNGPWLIFDKLGGSAGLLRDGKGSTYEGGMREPGIFWWPGRVKAGVVTQEIACTMDVFTTALTLAGAKIPDDRIIDGLDLMPLLTGTGPSPRRTMFYYRGTKLYAVRKGPFKAHFITRTGYGSDQPVAHDPPVLYDLDQDPSERTDVAKDHADAIADIKKEVVAHREKMKPGENQLAKVLPAQAVPAKVPVNRIDPAGLSGSLLLTGDKAPEQAAKRFLELAGGDKAKLVILSTLTEPADKAALEKRLPSATVLLTSRKSTADSTDFVKPLSQATGVWLHDTSTPRLAHTFRGTLVEKELRALLERGGVILAGNAATPILAERWLDDAGKAQPGLNLLLGSAIHSPATKSTELLRGVPGLFGIAIDSGAALLVRGRQLRPLGEGTVTLSLPASAVRQPRTIELKTGGVADYTALRRAAWDRTGDVYPPKDLPEPVVPKGSLIIIGGGGLPDGLMKKFVELAGGPDGLIVVLPTANPGPSSARAGEFLKQFGARNIKVLPGSKRGEVESQEYLDALRQAKGVWFGGGRQWHFVDAYEGTKAYDLFHDVLKRGGVIGGSSAGATIQGDYLCRGGVFNNFEIMYEGYERGFRFLPGVAIDQHFTQRGRQADMTAMMKVFPQFLGIGLDETTAILVRGSVAEVWGKGKVHFYDRKKPVAAGKPDYEALPAGGKYDLKARKVLESGK